MIDEFSFALENYRCFFGPKPAEIRLRRGEIVALVGPNNSGKSAFIRSIYELRTAIAHLTSSNSGMPPHTLVADLDASRLDFLEVRDRLDVVPDKLRVTNPVLGVAITTSGWRAKLNWQAPSLARAQLTAMPTQEMPFETLVSEIHNVGRTLCESLYIGPFRNIANSATSGGISHYDLQIGTAFVNEWRAYKTGDSSLKRDAAHETQEELASLLGVQSVTIESSDKGDTLLVRIDGSTSRRLAELGSGLAQLILTVISAAVRRPTLILIDEPELHLHPSMQVKFVQALARYARYGVVFSTHAVGLARQVADQIYLVNQDKKTGASSIVAFESRKASHLLGELSYSQFNALGGTHLLLVEGVTEVKTLRVLLRKLGIDGDVMIIPLGGSTLVAKDRYQELAEFKRTCAEIFVLVDSEKSAPVQPIAADRDGFRSDCSKLFGDDRVHLTDRRAFENYLTESAIQRVKGDKYRALGPYEKLSNLEPEPGWGKQENWLIADAMSWSDIENTDVGVFLKKLQSSVETARSQSGTTVASSSA